MLLTMVVLVAGRHSTVQAQPKLHIPHTTLDAGQLWAGDKLRAKFRFPNDGDKPLIIREVLDSCAGNCPGPRNIRIDPGATWAWEAALRTDKLRSNFSKSTLVRTNDPANPDVRVVMTGSCTRPIDMNPANVFFSRVTGDEPITKHVAITNHRADMLRLALPPTDPESPYRYRLRERVPGREFDLAVTIDPPFEPGIHREILSMDYNADEIEWPRCRVAFVDGQPVHISPAELALIAADRGRTIQFDIINHGKRPVTLNSMHGNDRHLHGRLALKTIEQGRAWQGSLTVPLDYTPPPGAQIAFAFAAPWDRRLAIDIGWQPEAPTSVETRDPLEEAAQPTPSHPLAGAFVTEDTSGAAFSHENFLDQTTVVVLFYGDEQKSQDWLKRVEAFRRELDDEEIRFVAVGMA